MGSRRGRVRRAGRVLSCSRALALRTNRYQGICRSRSSLLCTVLRILGSIVCTTCAEWSPDCKVLSCASVRGPNMFCCKLESSSVIHGAFQSMSFNSGVVIRKAATGAMLDSGTSGPVGSFAESLSSCGDDLASDTSSPSSATCARNCLTIRTCILWNIAGMILRSFAAGFVRTRSRSFTRDWWIDIGSPSLMCWMYRSSCEA